MYRFLFLITIPLIMIVSCSNGRDENVTEKNKSLPDKTGKDVEIIFSDSARLKIKLLSPYLEYYTRDTSYVIFPRGVHVLFYDDSAKVKTELTARYGVRYEGIGRMEARNNVVLVNKKGERLTTEHLVWDEQKQLIYTNDSVKIRTADEIIYGNGLESNQDFSRYKIKDIKGTLALPAEEQKKK